MSSDIFDQTYADAITSVIQATIDNNPEALEKLLEEKKSSRITDNRGWTPLHYACNTGYTDIVAELINYEAKINLKEEIVIITISSCSLSDIAILTNI